MDLFQIRFCLRGDSATEINVLVGDEELIFVAYHPPLWGEDDFPETDLSEFDF